MEKIITICGNLPPNFEFKTPTGNNFIFVPDPNFLPINLYKFYKQIVTVNSFQECYYYVSLGWGKQNIFSSGLFIAPLILFIIVLVLIVIFFKNRKQLIAFLFPYKRYLNLILKSKILILTIFIFEIYLVSYYVLKKSMSIPNFIDEYVALTSNFQFFTNLNFSTGDFLGGPYSVYLTSGPISAVGSVLAWGLSKNFVFARFSNFLWIFFLNLILLYLSNKRREYKKLFTVLLTLPLFLLIPWWQGMLYSLGEIASMVIFSNSIFIFSKRRSLAIILFSISIVYGKFLTLLPFLGFYLTILFIERNIHNFLKDILFFTIPLFPWILLVNTFYSSGNAFDYFQDLTSLIFSPNSASGVSQVSKLSFANFIQLLNNSEFITWNYYEKLRLLAVPIFTIFLILKIRKNEKNVYKELSFPIISSIFLPYFWFWFFSPLKWIRYSQHFMVLVLISLTYVLIHNMASSKYEYLAAFFSIGLLIDNNEKLSLILLSAVTLFIVFMKQGNWLTILKISLVTIILIDVSYFYFKNSDLKIKEISYPSCNINLINEDCRKDYLNY